jgi:hypothetical protein
MKTSFITVLFAGYCSCLVVYCLNNLFRSVCLLILMFLREMRNLYLHTLVYTKHQFTACTASMPMSAVFTEVAQVKTPYRGFVQQVRTSHPMLD